jgi:hypothetical protein
VSGASIVEAIDGARGGVAGGVITGAANPKSSSPAYISDQSGRMSWFMTVSAVSTAVCLMMSRSSVLRPQLGPSRPMGIASPPMG